MSDKELLVVKYGSSSVTDEFGPDQARIDGYADQLVGIMDPYNLIVVTSGAIAVGRSLWRSHNGEEFDDSAQPFAMLGSSTITRAWEQAFSRHDYLAGQLLITHREIDDTSEGDSLYNVLRNSLDHGIITVANENDALSNKEIAALAYGGDNDGLALHIAQKMRATRLMLMTDRDGLLDKRGNVVRRIVPEDAELHHALALAGQRNADNQGMPTKVGAAIEAAMSGIHGYIANANESIDKVLAGMSGTHFVAKSLNSVE